MLFCKINIYINSNIDEKNQEDSYTYIKRFSSSEFYNSSTSPQAFASINTLWYHKLPLKYIILNKTIGYKLYISHKPCIKTENMENIITEIYLRNELFIFFNF